MSQSSPGSQRSGTNPSDFVPPTVEDLDAVLDAYEFLEILGRGGMGAVYKARQIVLDRLVAIKILPQMDDENDEFRFSERFQREARAMARLSHANIIGVYDFGQTRDGQLYIVMEYVEGTDLHVLIRSGQLTTEHIHGWMPQICEAMQYAHAMGIVHRDIKPANIMINKEGIVKIADFGLAKLSGHDTQSTRLTMTNVAMGTPDYVAPEALEDGIEPDHRADLYAVGVMLYEMLTGKVPRGAWRPPSTLKPEIDPRFDDLVIRAMDADPTTRYQQATEISSQLTAIQTTAPPEQIGTPGGRKLNVGGDYTGPVKASGAVASGTASSGAISSSEIAADPAGSASSRIGRKSEKSNIGLLIGGIVVGCLAIAGVIGFLVFGGKKDEPLDLNTASNPAPTAPTKTKDISPAPPTEVPPTVEVAMTAQTDAESPSPEPEPIPEPVPAPSTEPAPDTSTSEYQGNPLLPVRRSLHLHSSDRPRLEVPTLIYDRNDPWTFEMWISAPTPPDPMTAIATFDGVTMCVNYDQSNKPAWHVGYIGVMGRPIKDDQRQHLAFQGDGENIEIFVDGVSAGKGPISNLPDSQRGWALTIGWGAKGYYDEIRFSKVTRYQGNFIPQTRFDPDADTVALWHLDDLSNEVAVDASGNGHEISLANFEGWSWNDDFTPEILQPDSDAETVRQHQEAWATHYGVPVEFENSIGMRFRLLPAGRFVKGEANNSDSRLRNPLYFGVHEVTQAEYEEVMDENPSSFQEGGNNAEEVAGLDTRAHPVESFGLLHGAIFCNQLSERDGFDPAYQIQGSKVTAIENANGYRLPTSEEWEYACRAGSNTSFFDGTNTSDYASLERFARAGKRTYPVGEKLPNPFGVHDIQGNVCEWVNGKYASDWKAFEPVVRFGGFRRNRSVDSWASWMQEETRWQQKSYDLGVRVVLPSLAAVASLPEDREIKRVTPPHPAAEKLAELESAIRKSFSEKVETPYQASLQKLNDQFRNALTQRVANAQGQVQAVFKAELDRITHGEPMPESDDGQPPAIVQLRKTWRQQEAGFSEERRKALAPFWTAEAEKLQQAATALDKQGITFFALQTRKLSNRLQTEFLGEAAVESGQSADSLTANPVAPPTNPVRDAEWVSLFDSRSLNGWTATGPAKSFSIDGDAIKASGEPAFLYYSGDIFYGARFRDFDFKAQVKTEGGASSGIFFHTANTGAGYPSRGYEIQIHNGDQDSEKTGSLTGIETAKNTNISEKSWFDLEISVKGKQITARVDGKLVLNHEEPGDWQPPQEYPGRRIFEGTFALQCHFPESGAVWFRDIQVRPFKDELTLELTPEDPSSIVRKGPDLTQLPKGKIHAFGNNADGTPFDLANLERGNDYVDVEIGYAPEQLVALRSRGTPVGPHPSWQRDYERKKVAQIDIGHAGPMPLIFQDGTLSSHHQANPRPIPEEQSRRFVDVAAGYLGFSALAADGSIYSGNSETPSSRPAPLGPTDIVDIVRWHSSIWGLRSNGKLVWFGARITQEDSPPENLDRERIVALEGCSANVCLALTEKGEVIVWGNPNVAARSQVPSTVKKEIQQIRLGWDGTIAAARTKSGKWIAWGSDKFGVVSKINTLGPEIFEMDFTESGLVWIE